jgi:hypothetical protein
MALNFQSSQGTQPILNFDLVSPVRAGIQDSLSLRRAQLEQEEAQRAAAMQPLRMQQMQQNITLGGQQIEENQFKLGEQKFINAPGANGAPSLLQRQRIATTEGAEVNLEQAKIAREQGIANLKTTATKQMESVMDLVRNGQIGMAETLYKGFKHMYNNAPFLREIFDQFDPLKPENQERLKAEKYEQDSRDAIARGQQQAEEKIAFIRRIDQLPPGDPARMLLTKQGESEGKISKEFAAQEEAFNLNARFRPFEDPAVIRNVAETAIKFNNDPKGGDKATPADLLNKFGADLGTKTGLGWKNFTEVKSFLDNAFLRKHGAMGEQHITEYSKAMASLSAAATKGNWWTKAGFNPPEGDREKALYPFLEVDAKVYPYKPSDKERQTSDHTAVAASLLGVPPARWATIQDTAVSIAEGRAKKVAEGAKSRLATATPTPIFLPTPDPRFKGDE